MIEKLLQDKLSRVFSMNRVTYDSPGESFEQGTLFIEVESIINSFKDGRHLGRVIGRLFLYAQAEKVPFGSLAKKIAEADAADTVDFFFHDFEENVRRPHNIVGRSLSFVFFFNVQYNPEVGTMTSINLTQQVSE